MNIGLKTHSGNSFALYKNDFKVVGPVVSLLGLGDLLVGQGLESLNWMSFQTIIKMVISHITDPFSIFLQLFIIYMILLILSILWGGHCGLPHAQGLLLAHVPVELSPSS